MGKDVLDKNLEGTSSEENQQEVTHINSEDLNLDEMIGKIERETISGDVQGDVDDLDEVDIQIEEIISQIGESESNPENEQNIDEISTQTNDTTTDEEFDETDVTMQQETQIFEIPTNDEATLATEENVENAQINESDENNEENINETDMENQQQEADTTQEETVIKKKKKPFFQRISVRIIASVFTLLLVVVGSLYAAMAVISYGPSPTARDLLINSLLETSAAKFVANIYFSDDEIKEIQTANQVEQVETETNTDLINIPDEEENAEEVEPFIVEEVLGDTFKGKIMIISDPTRVFVGASNTNYSSAVPGKKVQEIITSYGGIGGVNAGGFSDPGGMGNGGIPLGIVISQGELLWGSLGTSYEVIGIDTDNKLIVGRMTAQEALDKNIRDAVSFGPVLISNGEVMEVTGSGSGLNPRTAIGQRADGAMLLLVCDGRQSNSLGASYSDIIDVMIEYGAVNAANLDGGSSTVMYHNDELINVCASLYGPRDMPTAIVVGPEISSEVASNE